MSLTRRFLIAYVALVGVPLLLLVGVFHVGKNLIAPQSVEGVWDLHPYSAGPLISRCFSPAYIRKAAIIISQSGEILVIDLQPRLKKPALGRIQGSTVTAFAAPTGVANECEELLSFRGTVDSAATPATMTGELRLNDCPLCAPTKFSAVRETAAKDQ